MDFSSLVTARKWQSTANMGMTEKVKVFVEATMNNAGCHIDDEATLSGAADLIVIAGINFGDIAQDLALE